MPISNPEELASIDEIEFKAKENFGCVERSPYWPHHRLLEKARANRPESPHSTVTAFSDWVFGLITQTDEFAMERGRANELVEINGVLTTLSELAQRRQQARKENWAYYTRKRFPEREWQLVFDGTSSSPADALPSSALSVNGNAIYGKPDLVFRHQRSNKVLIIELKSWNGQGRLPPFGWPNLKVQLWCYGLLDIWRDAPSILLQGWVWRSIYPEPKSYSRVQGITLQPWLSNDPRVHEECLQLFDAYGGRYSG